MARRSSGGRSRPAPRAAARSPPPAPVNRAPAPAPVQSSGGGMLSGIGSTIMQGMAFGGGSEMARRAIDGIAGPRTVQHEMAAAPETAAAAAPSMGSGGEACVNQNKAFQDCISSFGQDISKCQFYMDMLAQCKSSSGSMMS